MYRSLLVLGVLGGQADAQPAQDPDAAPEPPPEETVASALAPATPIEVVQSHTSVQPESHAVTPPVPLTLRELVARSRFNLSVAAIAGLDELALSVDVGGSIALGDFELFASAPLIGFAGLCIEGCLAGPDHEAAIGNLRAGARYVRALGAVSFAPSVWGWLPTQTASVAWWPRARAVMMSVADSRAFLPEGALGAAFDVAWRSSTAVVQAELGVAIVGDHGPQVDNAFGALAATTHVSTRTSLLAEWRVDSYPRQPVIHAIGAGVARGDPGRRLWRLRAHVVRAGEVEDRGVGAVALGFDLVQSL